MPDDTTLVNIALKLDNNTDMVCIEIQNNNFLASLYTPLKKEDIKNKDLHSLSEQIRYEITKLFA